MHYPITHFCHPCRSKYIGFLGFLTATENTIAQTIIYSNSSLLIIIHVLSIFTAFTIFIITSFKHSLKRTSRT